MKRSFYTIAFSALVLVSVSARAQQTGVYFKNGSVSAQLQKQNLTKSSLEQQFHKMLGLSSDYTFVQVSDRTDNLGFTHYGFQQYYKGIVVDGALLLVHTKNGLVRTMNGRIANFATVNTQVSIKADRAKELAMQNLFIAKTIKDFTPQLVIATYGDVNTPQYALAFKTRIDGLSASGDMQMMNVYVDATNGNILKKISLVKHGDVTATAHTIYSGTRTITTDDAVVPGSYVLKNNAKNIVTYDATGCETDTSSTATEYFSNPKHIVNATTTWDEKMAISGISLTTASPTMLAEINPQSFKLLASMVSKNDGTLATWPNINMNFQNPAALPFATNNLYLFPEENVTYTGQFGVIDPMPYFISGTISLLQSTSFPLDSLTIGTHSWSDTSGNAGTYTLSMEKNPGLDAHWGMERTHDFYVDKFNHNSYDGNGGELKNYINGVFPAAFTQSNAAALPEPYNAMVYGLGDGIMMDAVVGLDVMGHEFTHLVTDHNGNGGLDYENESGALNESFSDIMATGIEFYAYGDQGDWLIGEDVVLPGFGDGFMRSMSDPKSATVTPQPDTYLGENWSLDDPHIGSGVQNKWFYLLSEGGVGTNDNGDDYNVSGIGMDKALQISYRNLMQYMTATATYLDAYNGSITAAEDLYGAGAAEIQSVKDAWFAVGIGPNGSTSVDDVVLSHDNISVYPNPATNQFFIESNITEPITAEVVSISGSKLMDIVVKHGSNQYDISNLAKGLYIVKFNNAGKNFVQKLSVR